VVPLDELAPLGRRLATAAATGVLHVK
jgi:hypothetical protein